MAFVESYTGYAVDENKNKVIIKACTYQIPPTIPAGGSKEIKASLPDGFTDFENIKAVATIAYDSVLDLKVTCEAGIGYEGDSMNPTLVVKVYNVGTNEIDGENINVHVILVGQ